VPISFSRILGDQEAVVLANTSATKPFRGHVQIDRVVNHRVAQFQVVLSSLANPNTVVPVRMIPTAVFWDGTNRKGSGPAASVEIVLQPMEFQILSRAS
jgi:hypothetical protein